MARPVCISTPVAPRRSGRALDLMSTSSKVAIALIGFVAIIVAALAALILYQNRRWFYSRAGQPPVQAFVANPKNDKALVVYGWSIDELQKILIQFKAKYEIPNRKHLIRNDGGGLRVVFPEDLEPDLFSFLVNYVQYPEGFDLKARSVTSAGTTTLSLDFGLPSGALNGKKAVFYIPTNDREHDLVYVRVDGVVYENSFAGRSWRAMSESRMPDAVVRLTR
jgi:hypothetical protein